MNKAAASGRNNLVFYYEIQSLGGTQSRGEPPITARPCNPFGKYLFNNQTVLFSILYCFSISYFLIIGCLYCS